MTLNLALWITMIFTAATSAALVLTQLLRSRTHRIAAPAIVATAGILLIGTLFGIDAHTLFEASPVAFYLAQTALPGLALILGGYLAARWYTCRAGNSGIGAFAGVAALIVAGGGGALVAVPGLSLALAAGAVAAMTGGFFVAHSRTPRVTGLMLSVALLWSAGFLIYLAVFPEQIAVGNEQPEDSGATSALTGHILIMVALVIAFILGFLKKRRG